MKQSYTLPCLTICLMSPLLAGAQALPDFFNEDCKSSIGFWENLGQVKGQQGQAVSDVLYYSQGAYPRAFFQKSSRFSLVLKQPVNLLPNAPLLSHRLDVRPYGAYDVDPIGSVVKAHYQNFYLPWTAPNGAVQVSGYDRLEYPSVYDGIDMVFYSGSAGQKMAFYCWPGSDPDKIALQFFGQDSLKIDGVSGVLEIYKNGVWVELKEALAYQVEANDDVIPLAWNATYVNENGDDIVELGFDEYDPTLPLVLQIGPTPAGAASNAPGLCWSSYFGGTGPEQFLASTTDTDGNFYVTGLAESDFMTFQDAVGTDYVGNDNAVVIAKFDNAYVLQWIDYYGGTEEQVGLAIKTFNSGSGLRVYVGGYTTASDLYVWPLAGAYNDGTDSNFQTKGFICRFDVNGIIDWGTYFGNGGEAIEGMDFDDQGRLYIVGRCDTSYPAQALTGATPWTYGGGASDIMVGRFNANMSPNWCTSIGGSDLDYGADIACDANGFYLDGSTTSSNFSVVGGGASHAGGTDVVFMRFSASAVVQWSRNYGGSGEDLPGRNSLSVDESGNLFAVGNTTSPNLPPQTAGGFFNGSLTGGTAGFIAKLASGSPGLLWSTYVSGDGENQLESVVVAKDKIFVAGFTEDSSFPVTPFGSLYYQDEIISAYNTNNYWGFDGMVMGFEPSTALAYCTYFGGAQGFWGEAITSLAFHADRLFLGGLTSKHTDVTAYFPLNDAGGAPAYFDEAYDAALTNRTDGFVAVLCTDEFTPVGEIMPSGERNFTLTPLEGGCWLALGLDPGRYSLRFFDVTGKLVREQQGMAAPGGKAFLDLGNLAEGIYTCSALTDLWRRSAKVIVQR